MLEEPANYKFNLLDLGRSLILGGQFVIHAINLGSAYLGELAHCGVKLIQRTDDEAATVNVDKSGALRRSPLGWIIYAHRKTAVRPIQDEVLNLSDRRLDLVDESVVFHALFMDGFMSSEHRPGFQKGRDLGVLGAVVYFGWMDLASKIGIARLLCVSPQ
jgi:hypothetical protein